MSRINATQLRRRIKRQVDELAANRLPAAEDFLAFLRDREPNAATRELLGIPGFADDLKRAEREAARGRTIPVSKLRRKR